MPRIKRGTTARRRHRAVLKEAKGYWGARHRWFRPANETRLRALRYAYRDRRARKRAFRRLWIARVSAAARASGTRYSALAADLRKAGVGLNRKVLAELAARDPQAFEQLMTTARQRVSA